MTEEIISESISTSICGLAVFLAGTILLGVTKGIFLPNDIEFGLVESNKKTLKISNKDM